MKPDATTDRSAPGGTDKRSNAQLVSGRGRRAVRTSHRRPDYAAVPQPGPSTRTAPLTSSPGSLVSATPSVRRGFLMVDLLGGMLLTVTLLIVLVMSLRQYEHGANHVARARQAAATAERVLVDLQLGRGVPAVDDDTRVTVTPIDDVDTFAAKRWVRVTVTHMNRTVDVVGVVPERALREVTR